MKKIVSFFLSFLFIFTLSLSSMATMEISKDVYGASKGCTTCHSAVPKAGDADKKLKPNLLAMKDCSQKTGKSCKGCHNGNPSPSSKCPQ